MAKTYRLQSAAFVHAPGMVGYCQRDPDLKSALTVIAAGWPDLSIAGFLKLMDGDYLVEGETVVVTVDD